MFENKIVRNGEKVINVNIQKDLVSMYIRQHKQIRYAIRKTANMFVFIVRITRLQKQLRFFAIME